MLDGISVCVAQGFGSFLGHWLCQTWTKGTLVQTVVGGTQSEPPAPMIEKPGLSGGN